MDKLKHSGVDPKKFKDVTFSFFGSELELQYFISTDIYSDEQGIPGLDKFEETFSRR